MPGEAAGTRLVVQSYERSVMARIEVAEIWTFRAVPEVSVQNVDLTGFKVEGTDGSVGKIDEATYETGGSYLVVDTGPWILGRKVMLPAGVVQRIDPDEEKVHVDLTKDEIKSSPEFDPDTQRDDSEYRNRLGEYYGAG
jgi:hypothetical protein